jgi:xylulokinase
MDTRATREAEDLSREVGARAWFDRTGKAMSPKNTASFPRWLERHEPQVFRAAARYTEPQDYLVHRLTGVWSMDVSSAAYCGAFDARTRDWAPDLAAVARIRLDQLSPVRPCGRPVGPLTPEAAEALGLPRRVVVCGGAHDQTAAALGVGAVSPGQALLSAGTAWVLYAVASAYDPPARSDLLVLCHAVPGLYAVLGAWAGCSVFDWFVRECCEADRRDAQAAGRNVFDDLLSGGWEGDPLLCLPHFYGACDDPAARGAVLGLTLQHTRRDLVRAAAQGVAFEARRHRDILAAGGVRPQRLTMIGGAARSRVWPQIVADALDTPVETPEATDAAALGAALLAGRGAGVVTGWRFDAPPAAPPRAYAPDRASVGRADRLYRLYLQAMDRLRPA